MHSAMDAQCDIPDVGGCGGDFGVVFFYTFILITALCLLNIFVAVRPALRARSRGTSNMLSITLYNTPLTIMSYR